MSPIFHTQDQRNRAQQHLVAALPEIMVGAQSTVQVLLDNMPELRGRRDAITLFSELPDLFGDD